MTLDQLDMTAIRWPETEGNDSESETIGTMKIGAHRWPETDRRILLTKTMGSNSVFQPTATGLRKRDDGMENISWSDMAMNEMEAAEKVLNMAIPTKDNTKGVKEDLPLQFDQQIPVEEKKLNVLNRKETNTIHKGEVKGSNNTRLPKRLSWTGDFENMPVNMEGHQKEADPPRPSKRLLQYIYEMIYHEKCGEKHRRVDPCPVETVHHLCGKKHSFVKNCNGTWKR